MIETTGQAGQDRIRGNYWDCVLEPGQDVLLSPQRASDRAKKVLIFPSAKWEHIKPIFAIFFSEFGLKVSSVPFKCGA